LLKKDSGIFDIDGRLEEIYDKKVMEKQCKFQVSRLFGILSAIVHNGKSKKLPSSILGFLNAMYIDILFKILNLDTEKRLLKFQLKNKLDISKYTVKQNCRKLDHLT